MMAYSSFPAGTLGFYLNGVFYPNGSTVLRTDIGEGDAALFCTTDSTICCTNVPPMMRGGDFFFPTSSGGGVVPTLAGVRDGYYRNRLSQHIRLHRQPTGTITGQFRCNIPNAIGVIVDLFIDIIDVGEFTSIIVEMHPVFSQ